MHTLSINFFICADQFLGKVDKLSLSEETLMELLIKGIKNKQNICGDSENSGDISEWPGLNTDDHRRITEITWQNKELMGSVHLEWLPPHAQYVFLTSNLLCGTVDLTFLPDFLKYLSLSNNLFHGTIDLTQLPQGMNGLELSLNNFSGKTDFSRLPESLTFLNVEDTNLRGAISVFDGDARIENTHIKDTRKQ